MILTFPPLNSKAKSVLSANGVFFMPDTPGNGNVTAYDVYTTPPQPVWVFSPLAPPMSDANNYVVSSISLSTDESKLYVTLQSATVFLITGIDIYSGIPVWWSTSAGVLLSDKIVTAPVTVISPRGWITLPQAAGFVDQFIPPLPQQSGQVMYETHVRARIMVSTNAEYFSPLLTMNGMSFLTIYDDDADTTTYTIRDETNTILATTTIPMSNAQLVMVSPENFGVLYDEEKKISYVARLDNGNQIALYQGNNYKPGAYLMGPQNPTGKTFFLFVRLDNASNSAWLQATLFGPQDTPLGFNFALWTVPTGLPFTEDFAFSTETGSMGLLPGIIYYQTKYFVAAVNMHNGALLWNVSITADVAGISSPIIATKQGLKPKYFVYVQGVTPNLLQNGVIQLGCCSGHGRCPLSSPNVCSSCDLNYFGNQCEKFCSVGLCETKTPQGVQRGMCGATGCMCNSGFYGLNCDVECTPAGTCNNHGSCQNGTGACICKTPAPFDFSVYSGNNCEKQMTNWFLIASIIGGALVVLLLFVIIIISCTKRKSRKNKYDLINN